MKHLWSLGVALLCLVATSKAQDSLKVDNLQEIVVTGTGTQHLLKNVPVQTEVISRKMLDSYGGKSIEEILSGLTASFAFSEGDMGSQMQLGGLGNSYILILIDGKRIHGDNGGQNDLPTSEDNSWFEFFNNFGYEAIVPVVGKHPQGLLELPGILNVWIQHTKDAEFLEDAYHSMYPEE